MEMLRLITAGNVDDGKSTLIGKLLHDTENVKSDLLQSIMQKSSSNINFAHLTDGLRDERTLGITVDVAYQYFTTQKRKYILSDAPGHLMYTKNLVTGASCVDIMIILIDAQQGISAQTQKHTWVASFLNIKNIIVAINKMDLVGYNQQDFVNIKNEFLKLTKTLQVNQVDFIPISALNGDNLFFSGNNMPWYQGETLMQIIENVNPIVHEMQELRFSVQYVIQHNGKTGYLGNVISGKLSIKDKIAIHPSNRFSEIDVVLAGKASISSAEAGQQICLFLKDSMEINRGAIFTSTNTTLKNSCLLLLRVCWLDANLPLTVGQEYYFRTHAIETTCRVTEIISKWGVDNGEEVKEPKWVFENEFAQVKIETHQQILFDPYQACSAMGRGILIDKKTNYTSGACIVI